MRQHSNKGSKSASIQGRVIHVNGVDPRHIKARVITTQTDTQEEAVQEIKKDKNEGEAE